MKRLFASILLILGSIAANAQFRDPLISDLSLGETAREMKSRIQMLSSAAMEGRRAGSEGEAAAAAYIASEFDRMGIERLSGTDMEQFGMKLPGGDTLRSRNVLGFIQGYDKNLKDHYIVIGASGLAMMLQLAGMLSARSVLLRRSVIFAAFGASLEGGAGAWYFLNRAFSAPESIDAMVNLDMLGTGSGGFYAYTCSNDDMNRIVNELAATLQPVQPVLVTREPVNSDHRIFYDKEIPSVFFTTGMYPEYNSPRDTESIIEYDDMERELEYIYNFTLKLANGPKPEFRHSEKSDLRRGSGREIYPYYECDTWPTFLGSPDPVSFLKRWVYVYLKYPRQAVEEGIQGKVLVDFVIDEKGKVKDAKVVKGVHPLLDDEALRVINASPDWKPGKVGGRKVKSEMSLYVEFRLEKKK